VIAEAIDTQVDLVPIDTPITDPEQGGRKVGWAGSYVGRSDILSAINFNLNNANKAPKAMLLIGDGGTGKTFLLGSFKSSTVSLIKARGGLGKTFLLDILQKLHPQNNSQEISLSAKIRDMIGSDIKVAKEFYDSVKKNLASNWFVEYLQAQSGITEKQLLKLFAFCKRITAIIAKLHLLHLVRYMFNRRFRNGRRSRRLLMHHAYQICYESLSTLLNEFCLAFQVASRSTAY
jgi:hypothetical protein